MVDTIYVHAVIIYPSPEASQDLALAYLWPRLAPFYHFKNCLFQGSLFHNPSHPHMQPYLTLRVHLRQFQHILLLLEYALFLPRLQPGSFLSSSPSVFPQLHLWEASLS